MSAIWKASAGPILLRIESSYRAETETYFKRFIYQGRADAIAGIELGLQQDGVNYDITNDGPVFTLVTDIPSIDPDSNPVDQYEIATGVETISIYSHEAVFNDVFNWDDNKGDEQRTFQQQVEDKVRLGRAPTLDPSLYLSFNIVVDHIRGGVDTFPRDYILLRRLRRVPRTYAKGATGRIGLKDGRVIYTTAQLNLPTDVAFVVPETPTISGRYASTRKWGWRVQGQGCEFVGQWAEQKYELQFAAHSLLDNAESTNNFVW